MIKPVLLISDDETTYQMLKVTCLYLDIGVVQSRESYEGIVTARSLNPVAIFVDACDQSSKNGWVTARIIKSDACLRRIPIAVVSNADDAKFQAMRVGCNFHVPRPIPVRETRAFIKQLLQSPV
jgi:CheY-like chemotaxis protein